MAQVHAPSEARRILQAAHDADDRQLLALLDAARNLPDSGYAATTLAKLATHPALPEDASEQALDDALTHAAREQRDWRRGEVLADVLHDAHAALGPEAAARVEARVIEAVSALELIDARIQTLIRLARDASPAGRRTMLEEGVRIGGPAWDAVRALARQALADDDPDELTRIRSLARDVEDPRMRARLLSYLDQGGDRDALQEAMAAVTELHDVQEETDAWRALVHKADDADTLARLHAGLTNADAQVRLAILPALVGRAYRVGVDRLAASWSDEALELDPVEVDAAVRLKAFGNLLKAHTRANAGPRVAVVRERAGDVIAALDDEAERSRWAARISRAAGDQAMPPPTKTTTEHPEPRQGNDRASTGRAGVQHHALGLHDTYVGGLASAHLRAVARAAPLCDAFDLDLVLFDFPVDDVESLLRKTQAETNIGAEGRSVARLVEAGRIHLVATDGRPPRPGPSIGLPVATTPHPTQAKRTDLRSARNDADADPDTRGLVCLVMGLGRRGLPKAWLDALPHHYEITGRQVSLETATAMGILAERLRALGSDGDA